MNLALTRAELGYRGKLHVARPSVRRDFGELAAKAAIVTLFS